MNWWKRLLRRIGICGFDYSVIADLDLVGEYRFHIMDMDVRDEIVEWCDKHFKKGNWKAEFGEFEQDDTPFYGVKFYFKHPNHASHFKLCWA